ncbi:HNH endonuclease signature motif containing protein [Aspergillus stella-maris]|uniref:HNH endonuclease signature motif containing protein n=1 Tax=Aspergillus stella-maris TaxID=1810926 RepID=UPI003CCD0934
MAEQEFTGERQRLLDALADRMSDRRVPPLTRACLWVADLERVKALVDNSEPMVVETSLTNFDSAARIMAKWLCRDRAASASTSPAASGTTTPTGSPNQPPSKKRKLDPETSSPTTPISLTRRSLEAKQSCECRDNGCCVISKDDTYDVAHIYPWALRHYTLSSGAPRENLWRIMEIFWTKERIESWHQSVFPQGSYTDACYNMMCLSPSAHRYHSKAFFALEPIMISDDSKTLTARFFWLLKGTPSGLVDLSQKPSLEGRDKGPGYARLLNHETTQLIKSGDEVQIRTEDPVKMPLPKLEILEMQWFLHRIAAMCGAADLDLQGGNDSEDEEGDGRALFESTCTLLVSENQSDSEHPSSPLSSIHQVPSPARYHKTMPASSIATTTTIPSTSKTHVPTEEGLDVDTAASSK